MIVSNLIASNLIASQDFDRTAEILASTAGVILSLAASYLPGFSDWYSRLDGIRKRLLMLGLLAACTVGIYALACAGLAAPIFHGGAISLPAQCSPEGALMLARAFIAALVSNQAAFVISPQKQRAL